MDHSIRSELGFGGQVYIWSHKVSVDLLVIIVKILEKVGGASFSAWAMVVHMQGCDASPTKRYKTK